MHTASQLRPHRLLDFVDPPPRKLLDILQYPKAAQKISRCGRV